MDFNAVIQAVATIGFPIVMCLVLMWYVKDLIKSHQEETEKFTNALNNNTLIIQRLYDKLNKESED